MRTLSVKSAIILFCLSQFLGINSASATEKEELALIIKQLSQVKKSLLRSEIVSGTDQKERYHFNYQAAQNDINLIIKGIESYLSPNRPQPRSLNFPIITGEYQNEIDYE